MSKTYKDAPGRKPDRGGRGRGRQRHISVRAVRRDPPDLRKLSRALIQLAIAEAAAEAQEAATAPAHETPDQPAAGEEPHD